MLHCNCSYHIIECCFICKCCPSSAVNIWSSMDIQRYDLQCFLAVSESASLRYIIVNPVFLIIMCYRYLYKRTEMIDNSYHL